MPVHEGPPQAPVWVPIGLRFEDSLSEYAAAACPSCRNVLVDESGICGLCGGDARAALEALVFNLELGSANQEDQPRLFVKALDKARRQGRPLMRVHHGAGRGEMTRTLGWVLMERGDVRNWVIGEVLGNQVPVGQEFAAAWPELAWSPDWNAGNHAVTWFAVG